MGVKVIRVIVFSFLLDFLFSAGVFARSSDDGTHHLPFRPAFHLKISKLDKIQNDKPTVHVREDPKFQKGEKLTFSSVQRRLFPQTEGESQDIMPQRDVVTPMTTVPMINPSTPTTTTPTYNPLPTPANASPTMTPVTNPALNPYSTPMMGNPTSPTPTMGNPTSPTPAMGNPTSSGGQSWCVASPSASETALQVALDYACGYGGADCSAIQQGGSCFNPDTVRDHASYAFNSYYQKNPVPTSCDFGGTAIITNTDPSKSTCQFPSSSTSSSTLNTTNPMGGGSTVFGSSPPDYTDSNSSSIKLPSFFTMICFLILLVYLEMHK